MKTLVVSFLTLLSGLGIGFTAQDKAQDKKPAAPDAMQGPQPGPEHKMLQTGCGEWDAVVHMGGGQSKAGMTTRSFGPFCTVDDFKGEMMGQTFIGHGVNGYDPVKKMYFSFWTDSFSPSPSLFWGTYDEKTKTMTMSGEMVGEDGKPAKATNTTRFTDADHMVFTMSAQGPDGKAAEMLKIEYARKKK